MGAKPIIECEPVELDFLSSAPIVVTVTQIIESPIERVWDVLADGPSWAKWVKVINDVEWTSPLPIEVGTTRTVSMAGGMVGYEEYLAVEEPFHFAFRFNRATKGGPEAFLEDYRIYDLGNGRTKVAWTMALRIGGASRFAAPVIAAGMKKTNASFLKKLASYVVSNPVLEADRASV